MNKTNEKIMNEIIEEEIPEPEMPKQHTSKLTAFLAGALGAIIGYKYL